MNETKTWFSGLLHHSDQAYSTAPRPTRLK